ncbi:MAG: GH3 auxin-responsive promoter family protein [Bacteroidetes bacterium]|nr:GH3 auxin-responsive promoter family protein [Bacteroidota bacterium]MBU1371157.1 GH3 auxin-responsive promoter family protein [Bacteroidota bacterium]MBU1486185.1 GH3 auxin-responsive promoter family protein [Bacteroidota bacterium]MBU1762198.1 GH3 auxin-responsive promoter family protein [Bacteroidota bacterium]MBU2267063.1 GH3 auxin-responsive promoter family protein [Bacteroidota bacterium]
MTIVNSFMNWYMKKRMHQIELFMKYPDEVQEEWFASLVNDAISTEWGKKYDYRSIENINQFKERVPVQNYDTLKPYIQRMLNGEQNILWPSEIKWFAKSSGTTNDRSKFIPVSEESLEECHFKGGKDMLAIYCNNRPEAKMFTGKSLVLGGSHQINQLSPDSFYGDLSAVIIKNLPFWAEMLRTPDMSIALMDNYEEKIEKMARATIEENVTNIAGVPTWTIVLAKRILEITGKKNLLEVWPNLELYVHGAVNFEPYREQFKKLVPKSDMYYLETYNASEGFFGIQDQSEETDLLLMLDYGIYYEFIPMEELDKESPKTISLSEVELDKNYAIVISTNAGLWRYMIGDTVKFTSNNPYRLKITGRTKHFINAFGEELIIDNAEKALSKACLDTGAQIRDYTACPIYFNENECGAHEWIIEFEKKPKEFERFIDILDNTLREVNSDYDAKRFKDMALRRPKVHIANDGTFYNWLKNKGKLGGQHKVPRLANERKYVDELLHQIAAMS